MNAYSPRKGAASRANEKSAEGVNFTENTAISNLDLALLSNQFDEPSLAKTLKGCLTKAFDRLEGSRTNA